MGENGPDVLLEARKIAKRLFLSLGGPIQGGIEMKDIFADVEMLGPPTEQDTARVRQ